MEFGLVVGYKSILILLVAIAYPTAAVTINFGEEDYSQFENTGSVTVTVAKLEDNVERIVIQVLPLTFAQFSELPDVALPEELVEVVESVDPAEFEDGKMDFNNISQTVTFEPSLSQVQESVTINLIDDSINEAEEGFVIVIQVVEIGSVDQQGLILDRNGVALVRITDNDPISIGFSFKEYTVQEDDGAITPGPVTILKENGVVSEQDLPVAVRLIELGQAIPGIDYNDSDVIELVFSPSDESFEIPINVIDDGIFEGNEPFQVSLSIPDNPPFGLNPSQTASTATITILDDEVATIGFEQPVYTVREGANTSVEVCFKILSPVVDLIDFNAFALVNVEVNSGTAEVSEDYTVPDSFPLQSFLDITATRDCRSVEIVDDSLVESTESFSLQLTLGSGPFDTVGNFQITIPETTVVIEDDDRAPTETVMCRLFEPLQVQPFNRSVSYQFRGTCEHTALSLCEGLSDGSKFSINVDFLTESMEMGAVGLFLGDLRWISREDGSFDDGDAEVLISEAGENLIRHIYSAGVIVELYPNMTTISFTNLDIDEVIISHNYGVSMPYVELSGSFGEDQQLCGLCGSVNGSLIRQDGAIADISNMAQVETFAQSYLVLPRDQSLRPQRRECGMLRNDTVIGDPLYAVPLYSQDDKEYSLCYEVFGRTNSTFNLVSDNCVSVNAHYGPMNDPEEGNIIDKIGVRAVSASQSAYCQDISVELAGCSAYVHRSVDNSTIAVTESERYEDDGISVRSFGNRVRIAVPNCDNVMLVMYVICEKFQGQDMIKFVITRGLNLRPSSHGLIGQFWNIPVNFTEYSGEVTEGDDPDRLRYIVQVTPESSAQRSFVGEFLHLLWDKTESACLYAGNAQGGPSYLDDPSHSVIEGNYRDYIVDGIFESSYEYTRFDHVCN